MTHQKIHSLTHSALMACMICISTLMIQIPLPGTGGYANPGDCMLLIGASILDPL